MINQRQALENFKRDLAIGQEKAIAITRVLHVFELRLLHHPDVPTSVFDAITEVRESLTDDIARFI